METKKPLKKKTSIVAVRSFVFGILVLIVIFVVTVLVPLSGILAVIVGIVATIILGKSKESLIAQRFAIMAIVLGVLNICLFGGTHLRGIVDGINRSRMATTALTGRALKLAIINYRINYGKFPEELEVLTPEYFSSNSSNTIPNVQLPKFNTANRFAGLLGKSLDDTNKVDIQPSGGKGITGPHDNDGDWLYDPDTGQLTVDSNKEIYPKSDFNTQDLLKLLKDRKSPMSYDYDEDGDVEIWECYLIIINKSY